MNNNVLTIAVRNKVASIPYGEFLVSDNTEYRLRFDLDEEWTRHSSITAHFNIDGWQFERAFFGNEVEVPRLPGGIRRMTVGLVAGELTTTSPVTVPIRDSILSSGDPVDIEDMAEIERVRAEAERVANENARLAAEAERTASEAERIAAETRRESAESMRIQNENTRIRYENARVAAEESRVAAEADRKTAELARAAAENVRQAGEQERSQNEASRIASERTRVNRESERSSNENRRIQNEADRISAESLRAQNESARISAESGRAAAENARAAAEAIRVQAENARNEAESARSTRFAQLVGSFDERVAAMDRIQVSELVREHGAGLAFKKFVSATAPVAGLTEAVSRFFTAAAFDADESYMTSFYFYDVSPSPIGDKKGVNATLVCEPSTNESAGRDDYADLPLFACFDCNYTIDAATLEPMIHAIKDVYGEFSSAPSDSFVGVLQMTGWVRRSVDVQSKIVEYAAHKLGDGFKPLPEAVRASDNSVRPFVIHAKYAAGYNSAGRLSSVSGVQPVAIRTGSVGSANVSHDGQLPLWREWGEQYGGSSICDLAFLQLMLEIKYATLGNAQVLSGNRAYNQASHKAAVSEANVRRILLTPAQAAYYIVGSCVSLGSGNNRAQASCYDVCDIARIVSKTSVTVDGTEYTALNLDAPASFSTTADATYIVCQPWNTGSTDGVRGNDGSPTDNASGKEPFKLQGIEAMLGVYEALGDTTLLASAGSYDVYTNRLAANARAGGSGESAAQLGTMEKTGTAGWRFVAELNWKANDQESYMLHKQTGGDSNSGYRAARSVDAEAATGWRGMVVGGKYDSGSTTGFAGGMTNIGTNAINAGITARACGTAGNRGVYAENGSLGGI